MFPRRSPRVRPAVAAWVMAAAVACTTPGDTETFDRKAMLEALSDHVIIPSFQRLETDSAALHQSAEALCAAPDAALLGTAQAAWRTARTSWKRTEAFRFGPVEELQARTALDSWPTALVFIDNVIAGTDPLDASTVAGMAPTQRGQPAAEYLLFGGGRDNAQVLTAFQSTPRRCQYLLGVTAGLQQVSTQVHQAWVQQYRAELTGAGSGSATYPTLKSAVDQLVNQLVATSESMAGLRLAEPLGLRNGGVARPNAVESPYADASLADLQDILRGIEALYKGTHDGQAGTGLDDYVQGKDAALDGRVLAQIQALRTALEAVPPPLRLAVTDHVPQVEAAYEQARGLKRIFATEVVATLGVTLTFNDNDGD